MASCRALEILSLDAEMMTYPERETCRRGIEAIMRQLCEGRDRVFINYLIIFVVLIWHSVVLEKRKAVQWELCSTVGAR